MIKDFFIGILSGVKMKEIIFLAIGFGLCIIIEICAVVCCIFYRIFVDNYKRMKKKKV